MWYKALLILLLLPPLVTRCLSAARVLYMVMYTY